MKNKKKFFSKNLYLEGLRQLRVVGLLGTVINLIIAVIFPVGSYLSAKAEYRSYVTSNIAEQFTKYAIDVVDYHIYYLLFCLVFAPLLVIVLFRFLNRRESCDFYHALPHTRQCLFLSFSAAAVTWIAGQIVLVTVVSAIFYQIFSGYLVLEFSRLFCFAANILAASLFVISVLLLACTLSGNTITSMIVFLILFFTPRIFITIYQALMTSELDYLGNNVNSVFNIKNNIFYNILYSFRSNSSYIEATSIGMPIAYTLFVAALLFAAAYIFFLKRRSEAAENSMGSRLLQTVFRTVFTMLLCMIPISILFSYYTKRNIVSCQYLYEDIAMMVFYIVISYIAVILGMFLYELLTTKNAKSALRSLKSLPVIAVLNIAVFVLLIASFGHYKNLRLDEEEIDSVNLMSLGNFYENNYYSQNSYFDAMIEKYDFTERELISLLCTAFNNYADMYNDYLDGKREHIYKPANSSSNSYFLTVQFHGSTDYTLRLQLDTKTIEQFYKLLYSNKDFYHIYMELPKLTEKDNIYFSGEAGVSEEFTEELYESLKTELAQARIDPKQWIQSIDSYGIGYIAIDKYIDSVYYNLRLPINLTTPNTYQKLFDYYTETHAKDLGSFMDSLQSFEKILLEPARDENRLISFDITGYDSVNQSSLSVYFSSLEETSEEYESESSRLRKALTLLKEHTKSISDMILGEDIMIYVRKQEENKQEESYDTYNAWNDLYILCIPMEIFQMLDTGEF